VSELWLGIDGAIGAFSAALLSSDERVPPRVAATTGNDALERGLAIVDEALAGVPFAALAGIAVGTGPGGFTGLRIALSYAKSLAFAAKLPLAGISSYDAVSPPKIDWTHAAFVHGRAGIACVRLRVRLPPGGGAGWRERIVCGPYAAIAEALGEELPRGFELRCFGAAEGAAPALGERGITVLAVASQTLSPALAIARRALAANAAGGAQAPFAGSPHALGADYGEAHYAERSVAHERSTVSETTP
jgi:tRNA threonylcarbamoyl adenosine modification protein YeaZ